MNQFEKESLDRILSSISCKGVKMYSFQKGRGYMTDDGSRGIIILDLNIEVHRIVYEIARVYKIGQEDLEVKTEG